MDIPADSWQLVLEYLGLEELEDLKIDLPRKKLVYENKKAENLKKVLPLNEANWITAIACNKTKDPFMGFIYMLYNYYNGLNYRN